jgi:S1-C subfamily serine protease
VDERANREGFGTAFRVGPSSVVTAGHNVLIDPGTGTRRALTLTLPLADETPVTVSHARWQEHGMDLAMGSVTFPRAWDSVFVPTQGRIPCVGEEVVALGYPEIPRRHVALVMHVGRIEAVTRSYRDAMFLSVSFASGPGLSGSPLIDASGYCVGVMCENTFTTESRRETNREEEIEIDVGNPGAQAVVGSALAGAENPPMERAIGGIVPPSKPYGQAMLVGHWIEMPLMFPR